MRNKFFSRISLFCCTILLSLLSLIANAETAAVSVAKDEWIKKFKPLAPAAMCQSIFERDSTKQIMNQHNISYDQCVNLIQNSVNRCVDQISPSIPTSVTNDDAKKWGREIGVCSGKDFYINNIAKKP